LLTALNNFRYYGFGGPGSLLPPGHATVCVCTRTNLDDTDERRCDREVGSRRADRHRRRRRRFPSRRRRDRPARPGPARSLSVPVDDDKPPCWSGRRVTKWYVEPDTKRHDLELRREIGNNGKRSYYYPIAGCWHGCLSRRGADLHMAQLMPLPLTVSCFSKIQIGFTILVPVDPGSPGQRAVKRVCVYRGANRGAFSVNAKRSVCLFFTSSFSQSRVSARVWTHLHLYLQGRLHVISIIINIDKTGADDLLGRSSCVL